MLPHVTAVLFGWSCLHLVHLPVVAAKEANASSVHDINTTGVCQQAIQSHCAGVEPGRGRIARCLREANHAAGNNVVGSRCQKVLMKFMIAAVRTPIDPNSDKAPVLPVADLVKVCRQDMQKLCHTVPHGEMIACLRRQKQKLGPACKEKVTSLQQVVATDIRLDPQLADACDADLERLQECNVTKAGGKKACLKAHRATLSATCRSKLFKREQQDAEDIRFNADASRKCTAEVAKHCKDEESGQARVLHCLWRKSIVPSTEGFSASCREKIQAMTSRSVSDYRLDFRVRTRCDDDIGKLCATEKGIVDGLTVQELFNGTVDIDGGPGKNGLVLRCLKKNRKKLSGRNCKEELMRVVRVQAWDARVDPALKRNCATEFKSLCSGTKASAPTMMHQCLREHIDELSPKCQEAELLQGSLEATDITLKVALFNTCRRAISSFCLGVPPGEGRIARCLQDSVHESEFPQNCRKALQKDMEVSNKDWRLKNGITQSCQADMDALCPEEKARGGGRALKCLKKNIHQIKATQCQSEVKRLVRSGIDNIKLALGSAACKNDAERFCKDVQPGDGRVHKCLVSHKEELSKGCAQVEFTNQALVAGDMTLDAKAQKRCHEVVKAVCKDVPSSGVWACLEERQKHEKMTKPCAEEVKLHMKVTHSEFYLNPQLSKSCAPDAKSLCAKQHDGAAQKDFRSWGQLIFCLMEQQEKVKNPDCKAALKRMVRQRVENVNLDPEAKEVCAPDADRYCADERKVGRKAVQQCLLKDPSRLSDACRQNLKVYVSFSAESVDANAAIKQNCKAMLPKFCKDISAGEHQRLSCLVKHKEDRGFDSECAKSLTQKTHQWADFHDMHPWLEKPCTESFTDIVAKGKCADDAQKGWSMTCLTQNSALLDTDCSKAVRGHMARTAADLRARAGMKEACSKDLVMFCGGIRPGAGRLNKCLKKQGEQLRDKRCQAMVQEVSVASSLHAGVNLQVRTQCKEDLKAFCKDVDPGGSRLLSCLLEHRRSEGFREECRDALRSTNQTEAIKRAGPNALQSASQLRMRGKTVDAVPTGTTEHKSFLDRFGGLLLAGTVGFVALLSVALALWVARRRRENFLTVDHPDEES